MGGAFLAKLGRAGTARVALRDVKAAFRAAHPEFADQGDVDHRMMDALRGLETSGLVGLPQSTAGWDRGVRPHMPQFVSVAHRPEPETQNAVAWAPELAFAAECRQETRHTLEMINDWLVAPRSRDRPLVPMAERSLDVFGDEKRLHALCRGQPEGPDGEPLLFGGALPLSVLRARRVEPPLHHALGQPGEPLLVVENLATYDTFSRWNATAARPFGAVAWGAGAGIEQSWPRLLLLAAEIGTSTVHYFGDLDAPGLAIFGRVANVAGRGGRLQISAHAGFYRFLALRGRRVRREASTADKKNALAVLRDMFAPDIAAAVTVIFAAGQAVPQESLGIEALSEMDVISKPPGTIEWR